MAIGTACWVLWWEYGDHSHTEIVRVFTEHDRALEDYELVKDDTQRMWHLSEVGLLD